MTETNEREQYAPDIAGVLLTALVVLLLMAIVLGGTALVFLLNEPDREAASAWIDQHVNYGLKAKVATGLGVGAILAVIVVAASSKKR